MQIKKLLGKLEKTNEFKQFKSSHSNAFFCAGFFIMNFKDSIFEESLDFRDEKELFTFKMPQEKNNSKNEANSNQEVILQKEELMEGRKPLEKIEEKQLNEIKIQKEDLKKIVEEQFIKNNIKNTLNEVIAVLQSNEQRLIWNLTAMAEGFVIVSIQIDALTKEILKFDKKNLLDFMTVKKNDKK